QQLSKMAINAKWRIGLSGTYPIKKRSAEFFGIVGALGNIQKYNDYELLRKNEQVSELKIFNLFLHYPDNITRACFELYGNKSKEEEQMSDGRVDFAKDVEFVMNLDMRNQFIVNFAMKTTGNTIVLFTRKDHGKKLFQMMQDSVQKEMPYDSQKEIFYIDGDVKTKKREEIRKYTNENENVVVVCSFGTFSVGVDIKNLHNAIYASNYKEQTKVIQSIGRIIRQLVGKVAKVYNLIDDFTYKHVKKDEDTGKMVRKTFVNFDMKHHKERLRLYKLHKYHDITNINISIGQGKNFEHD
ncbi:MAG: hypothetical protein GY870_14090, partial [archaeon]|nr:hypothetical protein [archaeon]